MKLILAPNLKKQMTNKNQIPKISMFKTKEFEGFGFFNIVYWNLFEIWFLSFGIYLISYTKKSGLYK